MKFIQSPPRFLPFTGKGGVGKTSIAYATFIQLADAGKRVLVVRTDPASNVGPVRGVLPAAIVKGIEEQLSGACTTEIAAFDEFTALLLLDATGAYHRDIARKMGSGAHFTTPMMQLQDPKQTKMLILSPGPGSSTTAWLRHPPHRHCSRPVPHKELREIDAVRAHHARRYALVPLLKDEPIGVDRLRQLAANMPSRTSTSTT